MDDKRRRFEAQVMPHFDAAYRFASWLAKSSERVDDVVQESMLRAFRAFDSLRGTDAKAWLLAIVRNCHLSALEQQQRHNHLPLPEEAELQTGLEQMTAVDDPETASISRDEQRELADLLAALPENFREVLVLREVEDMNYREIAVATNLPIGTVMSRLARARAALKKQWLDRTEGQRHAMS